ncbi:unnamed protein product [Alopecurus aequalis]
MACKKKTVTMERIVNDSARKSTCERRAMGVIKKTRELSTLCGVKAFVVIFPEGRGESSSSQMQVWPPLPEATSVIDHFKSLPEIEQNRKKMDAAGYVRERMGKIREQLRKAERENRQRETTLLLHDAMVGRRANLGGGLTVEQLAGVGWTAENLTRKIMDSIALRTGVKAGDPLPYAATVAEVEAPHLQLQQGWVKEVVKAGGYLDAGASSGGSGSYGSVGAGGDVVQLGNVDGGFPWADPGTYFRDV